MRAYDLLEQVIVIQDLDLKIGKNLPLNTATGFANNYGSTLRALAHNNDLYIWDNLAATHNNVIIALGLDNVEDDDGFSITFVNKDIGILHTAQIPNNRIVNTYITRWKHVYQNDITSDEGLDIFDAALFFNFQYDKMKKIK